MVIVSRAWGEREGGWNESEWKSVIQNNLVRAKWRCAEGLLSVGWQDEHLVNDCPLCQGADFFFPTIWLLCLCHSTSNTGAFSPFASVSVTNCGLFLYIISSCSTLSLFSNVKSPFCSVSPTGGHKQHKAPLKVLAYLSGPRLNEPRVSWGHMAMSHL